MDFLALSPDAAAYYNGLENKGGSVCRRRHLRLFVGNVDASERGR
jgi:hypothetical protein